MRVNANMAYLGVGLGVGALAGAAFMALRRRTGLEPAVTMTPTESNKAILAECPSLTQPYKVAPWLTNPHVETIFAALFRRTPAVKYERELLRMEDGGTVAVDWLDGDVVQALPAEAPMLVLLPGLTGGSHDSYVAHMALAAAKEGIRPVVFNSRGTSDAPVTSPQFYSASYTGDMRRVLEYAMREYPAATVLAAGWSLGANILLCYLGEEGSRTPVRAAVSLCNPFDLVASDENFQKGFSRVYDKKLAKTLKGLLEKNQEVFISEGHRKGIDVAKAISSKSIRDFDEFLTTKSFDWDSVDDYYAGSCSADRIPDIKVPVLCVQADNDPIAPSHAIPFDRIKANENCILVTTPFGGHLGWTAGPSGVMGEPWTDTGVVEYLKVMASRRTTLERGMQTGGTEAEEAFAEQSSRMETVLQQQVEAMGARDAELAELRVQLSAAQAAACEAGQGRAAAAAHIEDITKRERQWYEAFQVAQAEIKSLRAWIDGSAGGAATGSGTAVGEQAVAVDAGPLATAACADGRTAALVQQLQQQVASMDAVLEQQAIAAAARDAELEDLRVSFSAARAEAWQAGQAHLMAARALEVAGQKEAELQEQLAAALTDLTNMRAWADATFTSVAGQAS